MGRHERFDRALERLSRLASFRYEVLAGPGERLSGVIEAESSAMAVRELGDRGLHILELRQVAARRMSVRRGLALKQTAFITRQLASLVGSGVPLLKALSVVEGQSNDRLMHATLKSLRESVLEGSSFSDALSAHPRSFGGWYVSMIRAGETGGMLEDVLRRLATILYREIDLRGRVRAALAYPLLMILVGCITVFFLLSFVIPKVTVLFDDAGRVLPLPTVLLLAVSDFFASYWWAVLIGVAAGLLLLRLALAAPKSRAALDRLILRIPLAGELVLKTEVTRFCRVLGTLLGSGVPAIQALGVTGATLTNRAIRSAIDEIIVQIRQGESLSKQMGKNKMFPAMMTHVIAVGEQSGRLDVSLAELAEEYDAEIERTIRTLVSLLEPALIILVGGAVGFIVMAMLLPIFDLNEVIQ